MSRMRDILAGVQRTTGEPDDNVVPLHGRPTLDELERDVAEKQNDVIHQHAECTRAMISYKAKGKALEIARQRLVERLKESGLRVEFVTKFPELDDDAE